VDVNLGDHSEDGANKTAGEDYDEGASVEEIGGNLLLNLIGPDHRGVEESDHHIHVNAPPSSRSLFH
jgi:hypothetical protein